eukprot:3188487-Amphidinium_carterae.1
MGTLHPHLKVRQSQQAAERSSDTTSQRLSLAAWQNTSSASSTGWLHTCYIQAIVMNVLSDTIAIETKERCSVF